MPSNAIPDFDHASPSELKSIQVPRGKCRYANFTLTTLERLDAVPSRSIDYHRCDYHLSTRFTMNPNQDARALLRIRGPLLKKPLNLPPLFTLLRICSSDGGFAEIVPDPSAVEVLLADRYEHNWHRAVSLDTDKLFSPHRCE